MSLELISLSNEFDNILSNMNEYSHIFKKIVKEENKLIYIYCIGKFYLNDEFRALCYSDIEYISILVPTHIFGEKNSIKTNFQEIYFDDSKESFYEALHKALNQVIFNKEC